MKLKIKDNKKIILGISILLILIIFVTIAAINLNSAQDPNGAPKSAIGVYVEEAKIDTIISRVNSSGVVEEKESETIYVKTSLKIEDILVEVGDKVKKGQNIVKYDSSDRKTLENQLREAEINLENSQLKLQSMITPDKSEILNAESNMSSAKKNLNDAENLLKETETSISQLKQKIKESETTVSNNEILFEKGAITKTELDGFKTQLNELKDQLQIEEGKIESIKLNIENAKKQKEAAEYALDTAYNKLSNSKEETEIKIQQNQIETEKMKIENLKQQLEDYILFSESPIDGTVIKIFSEEGSWVNQGSPVVKIADLNHLIVKVKVSEYDAPSIEEDQKVILTGDAIKDSSVEGKVSKIAPIAVNENTGNSNEAMVEVEIEVLNNNYNLKPGYTVDAEIITAEHKDTVVIPLLAVNSEKDGSKSVYIMKDDYTVEKRPVTLGIYSDLYVEVDGIKEGEKVITNINSKIKEGIKVKPIEVKAELGEQK